MDPETIRDNSTRATITPKSPGHSVARNASFLFAGQAASSALALLLTAVLGRWLGAVEFGIYYLLTAWSAFAYVLAEWGQSVYLIREAARRHEDRGKLLGSALAFRTAVALVAALATVLLAKIIGHDVRIELLALLAVVCGLPLALSQTYGYVFRSQNRMDLDALVATAGKALTVLVTVLVLILGGGLLAVILLQAVGGLGAVLVAILLARKIGLRALRPERGTLQELASGGTPIALFLVVLAVQPFIDAMVLSALVPADVVGWYGAARNIMALVCAPAIILGTASFPELARVSESTPEFRGVLRTSWRLLLGLGTLAAVGTFMFADFAVSLIYGKGHFQPAVDVLRIFALVLPLLFIDILLGYAIMVVGKTKEMAVIKVLTVAISMGLAILLIPICQVRFGNGGIGSALAFGSTEVVMLMAFLWLLPRGVLEFSWFLDFMRAAAAAVGTMAMLLVLPSMTEWLMIPICIAVFSALVLASGLIRRTDLSKFTDLRPRLNS